MENESKKSKTCSVSQLDYESSMPQQGVFSDFGYTEYPSLTHSEFDQNVPLEFRIDKTDACVDLSGIYLSFSVNVYKADGTKVSEEEVISTANAFGYSLFNSLDLYIQDQKVSESQGCYNYSSYVRLLMNTTKNEKEYYLRGALWRKDEAGMMDILSYDIEEGANKGYVDRAAYIQQSRECPIFMKLLYDFKMSNVLPPQTEVFIRLHRTPASSCLMAKTGDYKIKLTKAKIYVPKFKLSPQGARVFNSRASMTCMAKKFTMTTRSVSKNDQNFSWVPVSGPMPKRIYFFQASNASYNGAWDKNIYNFQVFGLKRLQVCKNGVNTPTSQGLQISQSSPELLYAMTINSLNSPDCIYFNDWEFCNGYLVACFDLTQSGSAANANFLNPTEIGTLRIEGDYEKPLSEAITLFCLCEYDAKLKFDSAGNPQWLEP